MYHMLNDDEIMYSLEHESLDFRVKRLKYYADKYKNWCYEYLQAQINKLRGL